MFKSPFRCLFLRRYKFIPLYYGSRFGVYMQKHTGTINNNELEGVVGLEVHAQILSNTKLFSGAGTNFSSPVNSQVALFDAAHPGTLPVLNLQCVKAAVTTALALNCDVNPQSTFDRKHYFYADLPAGYQITQQRNPIARNGHLYFPVVSEKKAGSFYKKCSQILQLQIEQDSGRSLHDIAQKKSLIDLNRAGVGLMEIVFSPDLSTGEEAGALIKELILILRRIRTCSCQMEEGALRVDANISVRYPGEKLGVRSEVKNLGSVRSVVNAINFEIQRHIDIRTSGGKIVNETRSYDAESKETVPMRDKEEKQDYRFMPEPNLLPLRLDSHTVSISDMRLQIPKLPAETRQELLEKYKLNFMLADQLIHNEDALQMFLSICKITPNISGQKVVHFLLTTVQTLLNKHNMALSSCSVSVPTLAEILMIQEAKEISPEITVELLQILLTSNIAESPREIISKNNWWMVSDRQKIADICETLIDANPKALKKFLQGKKKVQNFFIGELRKNSNNCLNLTVAAEVLKECLDHRKCLR